MARETGRITKHKKNAARERHFSLQTLCIVLEIDAEAEANRTCFLLVSKTENRQQGIIGKEAQVVATHTERGIEFELVERPREIVLFTFPVAILHTVPLRDSKSCGDTQINVHTACWPDLQHQRGLQEQRAVLAGFHDKIWVDGNKRIDYIVWVILNGNIIVPTEIVPAEAYTCEQANSMSSIKGDAHIRDIETKIPAP